MEDLRRLIAKRGGIKGQMTQFHTYVQACSVENSAQLSARMNRAEELCNRFEEVQLEIEAIKRDEMENLLAPPTAADAATLEESLLADRKAFDDVYFEAITKAQQIVQEAQRTNNAAPQIQGNQANNIAPPKINIRLPVMELVKFNGNYNQWLHFRDTFTSVIDNRADLEDVQKLQYLKSALLDEALKSIEALDTTQENYNVAWTILKNRYENKKLIVNTHLKELFELQPITKAGSHITLRRLIDTVRTHLRAINSLGEPVDTWGTMLVYLVTSKLDYTTRRDWELYAAKDIEKENPNELPTMDNLFDFLTQRSHTLELAESFKTKADSEKANVHKKTDKKVSLASTMSVSCGYCGGEHYIYRCEQFTKLSIREKRQEVKNRQLCFNCLKKGHYLQACTASSCKKCSEKHNTLLHSDQQEGGSTSKAKKESTTQSNTVLTSSRGNKTGVEPLEVDIGENTVPANEEASVITHAARQRSSQVILATALIQVYDGKGKMIKCRALLDPGSQSNLVTNDLAKKLGLARKRVNIPVSGVGLTRSNITETTRVHIKSMHSDYSTTLECLILPVITEKLPQIKIDSAILKIPSNLNLADPSYHTPDTIDLLIGSGCFWNLLCVGQQRLGRNQPSLQKTLLGWIIGGDLIDPRGLETHSRCQLLSTRSLDDQLEKFWKIEEYQPKKFQTPKEQACEEYFQKTTTRLNDGRYVVRLPIDASITLGNSEDFALKRLYALERRLNRDPNLRREYNRFLEDYQTRGHMSEVSSGSIDGKRDKFFLPHQPIIRDTSLTTKVRVVFDGSAKSASGESLNDKLLTGPNLQEELIDIVLRFRCHQYVLTADVTMMFRQIEVNEKDRQLQQILWRYDSSEPVKAYTLNTVTYGTSCAPYLAMRCLRQLAEEDEAKQYSAAAKALRHDFYMDDVLTGCSDLEKAIDLQQQLQTLLAKGQFPLRKWRTNNIKILESLTEEHKADDLMILDKQEPLKTLGLLWNSSSDTLQYAVTIAEDGKPTKRHILSQIARIFDPLGLIGPVMITAKMMMQELWKLKLTWDEVVPPNVYTDWRSYYSSLPTINDLKIPRNVNRGNKSERFDIHGFGDASEKAYGACVYCSYEEADGKFNSSLLCSKTRVAPLKSISLPKLELCAALLLAKLTDSVKGALQEKIRNVYLWSDSTITLCWIKTSPHELKTFIANRVAEIQTLTEGAEWNHVPSEENPADMLSRGLAVESVIENPLWWHGPSWMTSRKDWPSQPVPNSQENLGRRTEIILATAQTKFTTLEKYSTFTKIHRIFQNVARFIQNATKKREENSTTNTLDKSTIFILRIIQRERFAPELNSLLANEPIPNKSPLRQLNPFIDSDGLIRVGGRLRNAEISADRKHPIVLPSKHHITTLILRQEHFKLLHCGPQHLLSSVRLKYWPLSGRREARKITQNCVSCFRYRPRVLDPMMSNLPADRVTEAIRPFDVCGVDYAGPFSIRESKRRGKIPTCKAYIAVFTCFKTKAVHLELVSSLSTEAFLAALKRFSSRRGTSSHIYSDNGSNFVGAARELKEIYEFLKREENEISTTLAVQQIAWHFIPPRAPHFGGLWEAAVKSVKRHLMITVKNLLYTFEEYYTLLTEIEAILNSRPLTQLSSDPNDYTALTPSHFLTGDSLLIPAERHYVDVPDNRLSRWQHLQKLKEHYWKRWNREYLHQLQTRTKWTSGGQNLEIGTLVLLIEDNLPPLQWRMGRVIDVHPGADNIVRVATVQTSTAVYKRAVKKLCALPYDSFQKL